MARLVKAFFILGFLIVFSGSRCSLSPETGSGKTIKILSYNVQNIFDEVDNGSEYYEYDPGGGGWDESGYHLRLGNLAEVIKASCSGGPDILALQEIENVHVAEDLASLYLKGMGYSHIAVTCKAGSAVQVGIISRLPLALVTVHDFSEINTFSSRPILEAGFELETGTLYLFNNHWKSRLGGVEKTEEQRRLAAGVIRKRIGDILSEDPDADIIIVGDLNESWDEYFKVGKGYPTALFPSGTVYPEEFVSCSLSSLLVVSGLKADMAIDGAASLLYTPWKNSSEKGSYYYGGNWEKIDHALFSRDLVDGKGFDLAEFKVIRMPFILNADGTPHRWEKSIESGYSDHLPLLITLNY